MKAMSNVVTTFFPNPFWNKSFGKLQAENARGVEKQHGKHEAEPQSDHASQKESLSTRWRLVALE